MAIERKSAAIMFTDIAGYTDAMSKSEQKALEMLRKKRSIIKPLIDNHKGTYVKEIGDGTLSYFASGYNASSCAKELQREIKKDDLNIRVGIHIGDIIFDDDDVYGDGVNIASRIESLAPVGGILISKNVYDELINKDDFEGIHLGLQSLKGVGRLVDIYAIKDEHLVVPKLQDYKETQVKVHKDDEVPSIAIIPFDNKGDDEDVFYAYGISADLISDCSSAGVIRVASLKDVEKMDYNNLETTELSEKLLVRYIAQGTLWKMDEMFQLSVELYDTKDKMVVWSDRWQEKWDALPNIKAMLSDGLLKALDRKPRIEKNVNASNTEAYEFYLKAKHKFEKRANTNDTDMAKSLLHKSIKLDDNLIIAKIILGRIYRSIGSYDKALNIHTAALKQSEMIDDKKGISSSYYYIGLLWWFKGDFGKAFNYYIRSLTICEEIGDKYLMVLSCKAIGIGYETKGNLDKAFDYHLRSFKIAQEIGDNYGMGLCLHNFGNIAETEGNYDKAIDYYNKSLEIYIELCRKRTIGYAFSHIGRVLWKIKNYKKSEEYLDKSLEIQNMIGLKEGDLLLDTTIYLYLNYKDNGKEFDSSKIYKLIKGIEHIDYVLNFPLYQLLEDNSCLKTAYNQVQELADNLEPDVAAKFLELPIPKAIVEEWEKVKYLRRR